MLRPIPLNPLVQNLLTLGPGLTNRSAQGMQRPGYGPAGLAEAAAPFASSSVSRCFTPQGPLGLMPQPTFQAAAPPGLLEVRLANFLRLPKAVTFATRGLSIRAALGSILRAGDAVILDAACDSAMFETVSSLKAAPYRSPPGSLSAVERRLRRLSASRGAGRLWVAVPAISAQASVMAEVADLADLCQHYDAGLIVDVTQDLGATGQFGGGVMEVQGCLGRADVVLGSFSRSFGAPGGFVALRNPDLAPGLARMQIRPLAASHEATILASLDLMESSEGQRRRRRLHGISLRLRNQLLADGVPVMGHPSPIVPVRLRPETALACTALIQSAGVTVSLLQSPAVAAHATSWCLHLTADHSPADIDSLADLIRDVTRSLARHQSRQLFTDAVT